MSIPVELRDLAAAAADRPYAYLLTAGADGRPHAVAVVPAIQDEGLVADVGRRSAANAGANPAVALVYPPVEPGDYSLIVDGAAEVGPAGPDGARLVVRPERAVLHRPAPAPGGDDSGCGSDCVPIRLD